MRRGTGLRRYRMHLNKHCNERRTFESGQGTKKQESDRGCHIRGHSSRGTRGEKLCAEEGCDLDHFEPHNILELVLFYCTPQKDTNQLAHLLMDEFGSLS